VYEILLLGIFSLEKGSPNFLVRGPHKHYSTVRRPDILGNVIVSGYVIFHWINKCLGKYCFLITDRMYSRSGWNGFADRSLERPALEHCRLFLNLLWQLPKLQTKLHYYVNNSNRRSCKQYKRLHPAQAFDVCSLATCSCSCERRY